MRLHHVSLTLLVLAAATAEAGVTWGEPRQIGHGFRDAADVWIANHPVQGENVTVTLLGFERPTARVELRTAEGVVLASHDARLERHPPPSKHMAVFGLVVPRDAPPGEHVLVAEGDGEGMQIPVRVHAAPHMFVGNAEPPAATERLEVEAVGFDPAPVEVVVAQRGQTWRARWSDGAWHGETWGEAPAATEPARLADARLLVATDGDESVRVTVTVLGDTTVTFRGLRDGRAVEEVVTFEVEEGPRAWLEFDAVVVDETGRAYALGLSDVEVAWPRPVEMVAFGDVTALLFATDGLEAGPATLVVNGTAPDGARVSLPFTVLLNAPPLATPSHGTPAPAFLLVLAAAAAGASFRRSH